MKAGYEKQLAMDVGSLHVCNSKLVAHHNATRCTEVVCFATLDTIRLATVS